MSEDPNAGADAGGGGQTPAANQTDPEAMPTSDAQAAPPSGNLGSADPQAPTVLAQSAVDGGVPRVAPSVHAGKQGPGRPGRAEPDSADTSRPVTGSGGAAAVANDPEGEVST
jgi:hypothetical protein